MLNRHLVRFNNAVSFIWFSFLTIHSLSVLLSSLRVWEIIYLGDCGSISGCSNIFLIKWLMDFILSDGRMRSWLSLIFVRYLSECLFGPVWMAKYELYSSWEIFFLTLGLQFGSILKAVLIILWSERSHKWGNVVVSFDSWLFRMYSNWLLL